MRIYAECAILCFHFKKSRKIKAFLKIKKTDFNGGPQKDENRGSRIPHKIK